MRGLLRTLPSIAAGRRPQPSGAPPRLRFVYSDLGAATRYRVQHQMEQAALAGLAVQDAPLDDLDRLYDLAACDLLYIYRLPLTSYTWPLCAAARRLRIPIVFDSDDLVWDPQERAYNYLDDHYSPEVVALLVKATGRFRALMRRADAFVFSTPYLARLAARSFRQPAYVSPNTLSREMLARAEAARALRWQRPPAPSVVIGYFCGTPRAHEEDVASIAPALCAVLDGYPHTCLRVYGELRLPGALAAPAYAARVDRRPAVDWCELPQQLAQVDINIAPLVDNPQRRAKSAVKYLEAALLGVPTVAQRLDPYQHEIIEGVTGLLAATTGEWRDGLARLIESADLRRRIGEAAREQVLAHHTTAGHAAHFAAIIAQVIR